jgi:uncharacterized protein YodC (DUF2158 family)
MQAKVDSCPFDVGDIVRLKSGGSRMTVTHVRPGWVWCQWMDAKGKLHSDTFDFGILTKEQP